ncbi:glycosyltransferase family 8 protein [Paracoccus sp. NGMCC 1.201697]|uniref:Glycosyltransferase family 8 protein n=1 Tax=Paracoccus broussonetiae subsp. drimophilus TaxID=3373869 RepID=A0ABW7LMN5_9RHOB
MNAVDDEADFAVVTCADHNMLAAACCALLSARNQLDRPARFFLVTLDATPADYDAISDFKKRHGLPLEVLTFTRDQLPKVTRGRWSPSVLTRLFLDQILPRDLDRVLYMDADTLVVRPMNALRRIGFMRKPAIAVDDFIMAFPRKVQERRQKLGLGPDSAYFNSGVILFDWPSTLQGELLAQARYKLETCLDNYHATDQDALNAALEGKWVRLSPRWNAQTGFLPEISKPVIVHFTGRRKPWQRQVAWIHREYAKTYRQYLAGTPWQMEKNRSLPGQVASFLLHLGKSIEGLRKSRKLHGYLNRPDAGDVWKNDND